MPFKEDAPPPQPADGLTNIKEGAQRGFRILRAFACETLFFRRYGGGKDVKGRADALLLLVGWAFFTKDLFCLYYLFCWLAASIPYAIMASWLRHPQWEGTPFLSLIVPAYWAACIVEAAAVLGIGYLTLRVAPYLGMLLISSGVGIVGDLISGWWLRRKDILAYRVGQFEMHARREAYKRGW